MTELRYAFNFYIVRSFSSIFLLQKWRPQRFEQLCNSRLWFIRFRFVCFNWINQTQGLHKRIIIVLSVNEIQTNFRLIESPNSWNKFFRLTLISSKLNSPKFGNSWSPKLDLLFPNWNDFGAPQNVLILECLFYTLVFLSTYGI